MQKCLEAPWYEFSPTPFFLCTTFFSAPWFEASRVCVQTLISNNKCMEWTIWPSVSETGSTPTHNKRQHCSCKLFFMIFSLKTGRQKILDGVFAMDLPECNYCASQGVSVVDCPWARKLDMHRKMTNEFIVFVCFPSVIRTTFIVALLKLILDATIIDVALRGNYT
jgi:hypothetical protein